MGDGYNITANGSFTCPDLLLGGFWEEIYHGYQNASIHLNPDGVSAELAAGVDNLTDWAKSDQSRQRYAKSSTQEDMQRLKYYSYGVALPTICVLGIIGNFMNLIVLTRPSMQGPAYVYMRGYAGAALLAIVFALPFSSAILFHNEVGPWTSFSQAFFHTHLELFLGNACLGVGVFMLVALTVERYLAVCCLGRTRVVAAEKTPLVAILLALLAVSLYLPYVFRAHVVTCHSPYGYRNQSLVVYRKQEDLDFVHSTMWAAYLWALEVVFKIAPTLIIVHLNCCIIIVYRRTCARRRRMTVANKQSSPSAHLRSIAATASPVQTSSSLCRKQDRRTTLINANGTVTLGSPEGCCCCITSLSTDPPENANPSAAKGGNDLQQSEDSPASRLYCEERRLMFLLGSTSILFSVCITPQLVLSLMIHERALESYSFQVFRAVANIMEVTNYSFTFYIYCWFSRDFRSTLLNTLGVFSASCLPGRNENGINGNSPNPLI